LVKYELYFTLTFIVWI